MTSTAVQSPGQGVRNTVRVTVKKVEGRTPVDRMLFIKKVLLGCCGFAAADVYCLQDFPGAGYFDVTFKSVKQCEQLLKVFKEKEGEPLFSILSAIPLCVLPTQRSRVVTIHMYNPYVPAADVLTFLGRYVQVEGEATDVIDPFGIWTSKRQVRVTLRVDDNGNILHPPSSFAIGGNRGYLTYAGQPKVCRACGKSGHVLADCKVTICRNCKQEGHLTKDCQEEKSCNLCGEAGHIYKTCPRRRGPTYAQMAGGTNVSRGPPKTSKVHPHSRETESGGTQKEQAGVEETAASGETQQLLLALAGQMEAMEEEVMEHAEEWIPVKNRKRKSCQASKASQQRGKRQLHEGGTDSSSDGEDGRKERHLHQKKRQSGIDKEEGISSQPGNNGPPEVHPPPSENQGVPTAPQLQVTESRDPLTVPLSDTELDGADPCRGKMTPERVNDPSEELDSYLSPAKVQQFVLTMGMQTTTPETGQSNGQQ